MANTMNTMQQHNKPNGFIFYRGPSLIDGKDIIGICIVSSGNAKTGNMVQTYIIPAGMSPLDASKTGSDRSVCGDCKHRGTPTNDPSKKQAVNRSCYVNLGQGPTIVYKALQRGIYAEATDTQGDNHRIMLGTISGRGLRLGTWGDPAAIPKAVWEAMVHASAYHTGYTHNLKRQPSMADLCMVSVDSQQQGAANKGQQRRTFRVIPYDQWLTKGTKAIMKHEVLCPASTEAKRPEVSCSSCKLCYGTDSSRGGSKVKSVAIVAHGTGKTHLNMHQKGA